MAGRKKLEELKLTTAQTDELIELYHSEADLWNMFLTNYNKKEARQRALYRITEKFTTQYTGLECTVHQVQTKLSYLRGYYSRELGKVNKSRPCGFETEGSYTSQWLHFNALDVFLRNQVSTRSPQLSHLNSSSIRPNCQIQKADIKYEINDTSSYSSDVSAEISLPPPKKSRMIELETDIPQSISIPRDINYRPQTKPLPQEINTTPQAKSAPNSDDEDGIFGIYVASELRKMKDDRTKALLKLKIQSAIFEVQYGDP